MIQLITVLFCRCWDTLNSLCTFSRRMAELNTAFSSGSSLLVYRITSKTLYGFGPAHQKLS